MKENKKRYAKAATITNIRLFRKNPLVRSTRPKDLVTRYSYYFLLIIALCSPWGELFRIGTSDESSGRGVTTICGIAIIGLSFIVGKGFRTVHSRPVLVSFPAFVLLAVIATIGQKALTTENLVPAITQAAYWAFAVAVLALRLDEHNSRFFIRLYAFSATGMALASLLDYWGVLSLPRFNEVYSGFTLEGSIVGRDLIGPFDSRSALAAYLALAWPVPFMELLYPSKVRPRLSALFWGTVLCVLSLAVFFCTSRSLFITVACVGIYAFFCSGGRRRLKLVLFSFVSVAVAVLVFQNAFPDQVKIVSQRVSTLRRSEVVEAGGHVRIDAFLITIEDLHENPFGMGFGLIEELGLNAHSTFTDYLRPAGPFGFLLVCVFMWPPIKVLGQKKREPAAKVLGASFVGVLSCGIAHSMASMIAGWAVIGILYNFAFARMGACSDCPETK